MVFHLQHRQARGDQVAEALAPPARIELVHRGAEEQPVAGQQRRQLGRLVARRARHVGVALGDLLQAQHVEAAFAGQAARAFHNARGAHHAVEAAAPLGVPGDEFHGVILRRAACGGLRYLMPARMKLCTNWRWNSRKATSSGPEVISVAAVMTDQSTP